MSGLLSKMATNACTANNLVKQEVHVAAQQLAKHQQIATYQQTMTHHTIPNDL